MNWCLQGTRVGWGRLGLNPWSRSENDSSSDRYNRVSRDGCSLDTTPAIVQLEKGTPRALTAHEAVAWTRLGGLLPPLPRSGHFLGFWILFWLRAEVFCASVLGQLTRPIET